MSIWTIYVRGQIVVATGVCKLPNGLLISGPPAYIYDLRIQSASLISTEISKMNFSTYKSFDDFRKNYDQISEELFKIVKVVLRAKSDKNFSEVVNSMNINKIGDDEFRISTTSEIGYNVKSIDEVIREVAAIIEKFSAETM